MEAFEGLHRCCLTRTVGAEQGDDFTGVGLEADSADGGQIAVTDDQVLDLYRVHRREANRASSPRRSQAAGN